MSSSKKKLVVDKSSSDDKSKLSVFDRLGPGLEVRCLDLSMLSAVFAG